MTTHNAGTFIVATLFYLTGLAAGFLIWCFYLIGLAASFLIWWPLFVYCYHYWVN